MSIPYRTRRFLKRLVAVVLVLAVLALVIGMVWVLWVGRFVVYTRDQGVIFDFQKGDTTQQGQLALPPSTQETVSIYYNEGDNAINNNTELTQMVGYYITAQALEKDQSAIRPQLEALEEGTPVMIDVKSIQGNFFYSSSVGQNFNKDLDIEEMDKLLRYLNSGRFYTIARLPALRDFHYGLEHVPDGLPTAGGYLWMDQDNCYWLNPLSSGTREYLVNIVQELKTMGFDEVVFYDYYFPQTDKIVFNSSKPDALKETAQYLVDKCTSDSFAVSFTGGSSFALPEGRSRLYIEGAVAAEAVKIANASDLENPQIRLVFLTELYDTRFDSYSVLRPLEGAH